MSWRAASASAIALVLTGCGAAKTPAPPPSAQISRVEARSLLVQHRPFYALDSRDRNGPTTVDALISRAVLRTGDGRTLRRSPTAADLHSGGADQVLDGPDDGAPSEGSAVYGAVRRQDGRTWLQYWAFLPDNPQDRGILRSGRHEGDWEFSQVGLGSDQQPTTITVAQHKWAEGCPWTTARRIGQRPVLYLANGSHATYLTAGEHGRPWPDPDDEARGDGPRTDPRLLRLDGQPWLRWAGRWGGSSASPVIPIEATSPVGPAFQDADQDSAPTAFHDGARPCGSGAPTATRNGIAGVGGVAIMGLVVWHLRRRRRRAPRPSAS